MTFMVDGKQYVALQVGTGRGVATGFAALRQDGIVPPVNPDVPHGTGDNARPQNQDTRPPVNPRLMVYALDGTAKLP
jgi:hypothetical protein